MDADERSQPQSRIRSRILTTFSFGSTALGSGETDEGSGDFRDILPKW